MELLLKTAEGGMGEMPFKSTKSNLEAVTFTQRETLVMRCDTQLLTAAPASPDGPFSPAKPGGPAIPCSPVRPTGPTSPRRPLGPSLPAGPGGPGGPVIP